MMRMLLMLSLFLTAMVEGSSSSPGDAMMLRVRNPKTGQMERLLVSDPTTQSLNDVLSSSSSSVDYCGDGDDLCCKDAKSKKVLDMEDCISNLSLSNGAMLILSSSATADNNNNKPRMKQKEITSSSSSTVEEWEPFPELSRRNQYRRLRRQSRRRVNSFGDYSDIYHVVEAQPKGPMERFYLCSNGASQFQLKCNNNNNNNNRMAWLFGTVQQERVDRNKRRPPKTSLSSTTESSKMCTVAKVQATWEPPQTTSSSSSSTTDYDASSLLNPLDCPTTQRAFTIAQWLGLQPVGWIFSYNDNRNTEKDHDEDAAEGILPVTGKDVYNAAKAQCFIMKHHPSDNTNNNDDDDGETPRAWMTAAMDANTGETEIFQLSDVSVQMVHEGVIEAPTTSNRHMKTTQPIMVASQEQSQLDAVLCLVNTALLSHTGLYSTSSKSTGVTKKGFISKATKAKLQSLLNTSSSSSSSADILKELCNFPLLVALDRLLSAQPKQQNNNNNNDDDDDDEPMKQLCELVRRYARGQTKSTKIPMDLQLLLQHVLQ